VRVFTGHGGPVIGVAASPRGTLVATASRDATARLWDIATGVAKRTLEGHAGAVYGVAFSPDGALLAAAATTKQHAYG
jgi:WD40 repeat protein